MTINQSALALMAERLVSENGRSVTIIKYNATVADPSKPWKSPTDARTAPAASVTTPGVFVPASSLGQFGHQTTDESLLKNSDQVLLVAPGDNFVDDLSGFHEVIDEGSTRWKIDVVEKLRPSTTTMLYMIGVSR